MWDRKGIGKTYQTKYDLQDIRPVQETNISQTVRITQRFTGGQTEDKRVAKKTVEPIHSTSQCVD
jgi:hypothetical protein